MSEPRAYQSGAPYCAPFLGGSLPYSQKLDQWKANYGKTVLLDLFVSGEEKKSFVTSTPGTNVIKLFYGRNLQMFVIS
jgi:hypothetical protein